MSTSSSYAWVAKQITLVNIMIMMMIKRDDDDERDDVQITYIYYAFESSRTLMLQ
jgi:hypothetical protein